MGKKPETKFKEKIYPILKTLPRSWIEKIQQVAKRGTPDFLCCINGTFVAMELKKDEEEEPMVLQRYKLKQISDAGGVGLVVHPGNWDTTYEFLHMIATEGLIEANKHFH